MTCPKTYQRLDLWGTTTTDWTRFCSHSTAEYIYYTQRNLNFTQGARSTKPTLIPFNTRKKAARPQLHCSAKTSQAGSVFITSLQKQSHRESDEPINVCTHLPNASFSNLFWPPYRTVPQYGGENLHKLHILPAGMTMMDLCLVIGICYETT